MILQEEFKKQHPDYTYRKARRKRALNELLTKSTHGYAGFPGAGVLTLRYECAVHETWVLKN